MKEHKDEKWLSELISETINTEKPVFDAEKWKEKYPEEFRMLVYQAAPTPQPKIGWRRAAVITIAACLILLFCLFSTDMLNKNKDVEIGTSPYYILPDYQTSHLQETKPWDILPPLPN